MRTHRSWIALALALVVYASLPAGTAHAVEAGHFGGGGGHFGGEHLGGGAEHLGGVPGHWPEHHWDRRPGWGWHGVDVDRWHGGHWVHGEHLGRFGWWWVVGAGWYFYPASVYPYPDPYVPPAVVSPSAGYWYYCNSANAYYPYVTECPEGWTPVVPEGAAS
jgi:hypothetical protein